MPTASPLATKGRDVVRSSQALPPAELPDRILAEISQWHPASSAQQDDIMLIVID
jgi:hypothetical protein